MNTRISLSPMVLPVFLSLLVLLSTPVLLPAGATGESPPEPAAETGAGEGTAAVDSLESLSGDVLAAVDGLDGTGVLAVLDIRNADGRDSVLGNYLEEELTNFLFRESGKQVVERNSFEQVLSEWELSLTGLIAEDTAAAIGSATGADALLTGTMTEVDGAVRVNLRILDTDSVLVLASIEGVLIEDRYPGMYRDVIEPEKELTDEDFFIGRGRDFDGDKALMAAFLDFCTNLADEMGTGAFPDYSFVDYLAAVGELERTHGSRENVTIRLRRDLLTPEYLYRFFFEDGRSTSLYYFDEGDYGWETNPLFMMLVEQDYDTFGVPDVYRNAVARMPDPIEAWDWYEKALQWESQYTICGLGISRDRDWAVISALVDVAQIRESAVESVLINTDESSIHYGAYYARIPVLEEMVRFMTGLETGDVSGGSTAIISVDLSEAGDVPD